MTKQEARDLVAQVCRDYRRSLPKTIQFYQSTTRRSSSGRYWGNYWGSTRLHVTLGMSGTDHKETVLHEAAHHLVARTKKGHWGGHTIRFWKLHYELCERYGATVDHARNVRYRAKAADARPTQYEPNTQAVAELLILK